MKLVYREKLLGSSVSHGEMQELCIPKQEYGENIGSENSKCYKIGEKDLVTRDNDFEMATGNSTGVIGYDSRIKKKGTNQVDRTKASVPTTLLNSAITNYCSDPQKIMFVLQKTDADVHTINCFTK